VPNKFSFVLHCLYFDYRVTNGCQGVMLTMPFTVAVYMVRGFLQAQQLQQQQQNLAAADSGDVSMLGSGNFTAAAAAAAAGAVADGVDEQLVGQLTGALVSVRIVAFACFVFTFGGVRGRDIRPGSTAAAAAAARHDAPVAVKTAACLVDACCE
jgi:hypothetical protein